MDGFFYGVKRETQASLSYRGAEQVYLPLQKLWNPVAGYFIPISPPEGELDFPILKDKIRSLALPTSPTSVASLVVSRPKLGECDRCSTE